ncbi:hypothetical protein G6F59_018775 [Rhizopus arrhizus]|nr:hypothetical protein G6F59_018775 [Rhizopus arrhizus]
MTSATSFFSWVSARGRRGPMPRISKSSITTTRRLAAAWVEAMPGRRRKTSMPPPASSDACVTTIRSGARAPTASADKGL